MARMLAAEPEVLLLDEPFAALDSYLKWKMEQQMLELLQKVQTPVLFVSHSRDEVYRLCDTVSCIHQGRMEVIEPVKEFFRNPKTKTAALLSGCKNICAVEAMESHRDGNWLWHPGIERSFTGTDHRDPRPLFYKGKTVGRMLQ